MNNKTVLILKDKIPANAAADFLDNEAESSLVSGVLRKLEYDVMIRDFDLKEIQALIDELTLINLPLTLLMKHLIALPPQ